MDNPYRALMDAVNAPQLVELGDNPLSVEAIFEQLKKRILAFQAGLDKESEVGIMLANFGSMTVLQVHSVTYREPSLICIIGAINGKRCEIVQHVSQLSLLLVAEPKASPDAKPRQIGFLPPPAE